MRDTQTRILARLYFSTWTAKKLAADLIRDVSNVTTSLNDLKKQGYLDHDGRKPRTWFMTDNGRKMFQDLPQSNMTVTLPQIPTHIIEDFIKQDEQFLAYLTHECDWTNPEIRQQALEGWQEVVDDKESLRKLLGPLIVLSIASRSVHVKESLLNNPEVLKALEKFVKEKVRP